METAAAFVQCTHCGVEMTSWRAQGSPIRYYRCPLCQHVHSSHYEEVFRRGAGARFVRPGEESAALPAQAAPVAPAAPIAAEPASEPDPMWRDVKARAASWFDRLERENVHRRAPSPANEHPAAYAVLAAARDPNRHR